MKDNILQANSVFEQPWWLDIVAPGCWGEVFVKEGDEVVARLPYMINKEHISMPRLTQTLGIWMKPEYRLYQFGNTQLSRQKEIIKDLLKQLPKHKSFNMTFDSVNDYVLPYRWLGYRYTPSFSYRICELNDLEGITNNFHKSIKKNLKRAKKLVFISNEPDAEILINIIKKTFAHQKRKNPIQANLIRKIVEISVELKSGKMFTAFDEEGHVHACSFMVYDSNCAYALLGGTDPEYRGSGAKTVVWNNEISFASSVSNAFDFEGSNIETIEYFVRQFGGKIVTNYSISKQSFLADCMEMAKPRIKNLIGYKV